MLQLPILRIDDGVSPLWVKGQVYSCTTCDELIRISGPNEEPDPGSGAGG